MHNYKRHSFNDRNFNNQSQEKKSNAAYINNKFNLNLEKNKTAEHYYENLLQNQDKLKDDGESAGEGDGDDRG